MLKLIIGDKRTSSWSMRPWLLMRALDIGFEEEMIPFHSENWHRRIGALGGVTVPILLLPGAAVGDSLAIAETLAELFPEAGVWPAERLARMRARALCAEMHASFGAIREECAFDAFRHGPPRPLSGRATTQLRRAEAIFASAPAAEFLCGRFCAADAFYAPLALRVLQYGLEVNAAARTYIERIAALAPVQTWLADAERERGWPEAAPGRATWRRTVVSAEDALLLAQRWTRSWNAGALDAVLEMFADDVEFVSPKAQIYCGTPRVSGKAALRTYWARALDAIGPLEFALDGVDWDGPASAVLVRYRARLGTAHTRAAERWVIAPDGLIVSGEAYYGAPV
jgi:glutathione S-transferase